MKRVACVVWGILLSVLLLSLSGSFISFQSCTDTICTSQSSPNVSNGEVCVYPYLCTDSTLNLVALIEESTEEENQKTSAKPFSFIEKPLLYIFSSSQHKVRTSAFAKHIRATFIPLYILHKQLRIHAFLS